MKKKFMIMDFQKCKDKGRMFTLLLAYDYTFARIIDESDAEAILVSDSHRGA